VPPRQLCIELELGISSAIPAYRVSVPYIVFCYSQYYYTNYYRSNTVWTHHLGPVPPSHFGLESVEFLVHPAFSSSQNPKPPTPRSLTDHICGVKSLQPIPVQSKLTPLREYCSSPCVVLPPTAVQMAEYWVGDSLSKLPCIECKTGNRELDSLWEIRGVEMLTWRSLVNLRPSLLALQGAG
jgi:hypothetical protein